MNQTEQMCAALREFIAAMDNSCDHPDTSSERESLRHVKRQAEQTLARVKETPKNEHGSDDVLKRAPLVRLTDEDIKVLQAFHNFNVCTTSDKDLVTFARAIQDAMQEKNK